MNIINNNPYRLLGVYSTSSQREVVSNQGRMKAFLKVGRPVTFPLDLDGILPSISRNEESVADAVPKLSLPAEQLKYAQFWFAKSTPIDDIAFSKLTNGDINGAIGIWSKKETVSSLQNLLICAIIKDEIGKAITYAEKLYSSYSEAFVKMVLGENALATSGSLANDFLDVLCIEFDTNQLVKWVTIPEWKEYISKKSIKPLVDKIMMAVETCKSSKGKGINARYFAGIKLMNDTKADLAQLKTLVATNDLQYQMLADKLGQELLQCSIDYYNDSGALDAAQKSLVLQKYALSVVVGKMAKDRCKKNVDILTKIIAEAPPSEVVAEDKAIKEKLANISKQDSTISNAIALLNDTKGDLVSIKNKLGVSSAYYLKMSTTVVNCALGFVIDEVNKAQSKIMSFEEYLSRRRDPYFPLDPLLQYELGHLDVSVYNAWVELNNSQLECFKDVALSAWKATKIMDKFDLEKDFKRNRYDQQRKSLKNICKQIGVSTRSYNARTGLIFAAIGFVIGAAIGGIGGAIAGAVIGGGCIVGLGLFNEIRN